MTFDSEHGSSYAGYRIVRQLGSAGLASIFAAQPPVGAQLVRLLEVHVDGPRLVLLQQGFARLAELTHLNLVRLDELIVPASGVPFVTMELVEGETLVDWVRGRAPAGTAPSLTRVQQAMRQLAAGVQHLHAAGRVHLDLKPSNAIVSDQGRLVLHDFGLVHALSHTSGVQPDQLLGTPAYMAPEQILGVQVTRAADLHAIGVILFECLTGTLPFAGSLTRMFADKQGRAAPDPRSLAADVPEHAARLCNALLERDAAARPSAKQLIDDIEDQNIWPMSM